MVISLKKGDTVSLDDSVRRVLVQSAYNACFELDLSAFLLGENEKIQREDDAIFYGNLIGRNGLVVHWGDDLYGIPEGYLSQYCDFKSIDIDLAKVPEDVKKITICISKYLENQAGETAEISIRVTKTSHERDLEGEELIRLDLKEKFSEKNAIVVGEFSRNNGKWEFNVVGDGYKGGLPALAIKYGSEEI